MKLKILTAFLLATAMTVMQPLNTKAEEGCSNYPFKANEAKFMPLKDGQFKLLIMSNQLKSPVENFIKWENSCTLVLLSTNQY